MMNHAVICVLHLLIMNWAALAQAERPNVLLIVSDDQGYADAGFQGSRDLRTPHLDQLAADGVRCTDGYVSHPVCSPSRAGFLTGRYQQRFGHERNPAYDPGNHREGLPVTERLVTDHLQAAGYVTGWIGKWHLGAAPEFRPQQRGFQETFGFLGGGHRFFNWQVDPGNEYQSRLTRNGEPVDVHDHLTLALGQEAAAFVQRHPREPWFLYLAFNAPHNPQEPTPQRLAQFEHLSDPRRRAYAAQLSLLDDAVGGVLDALRQTDQYDRTLVFFFSDNGGPIGERSNGSSNAPLRGGKSKTYEGGIRVPFLVSWPAQLPHGASYELPVSSLDVFATSLAAAGVPMPADRVYDSVDLVPYLTGARRESPHPYLFWRNSSSGYLAVRAGNQKLVRPPGAPDEYYQLDTDIGESRDLSASHAETASQLARVLDAWNAELIDPVFPGAAIRRPRPSSISGD